MNKLVKKVSSKELIPENVDFEYRGLPEGCASYDNLEDFNITVTLNKGDKIERNNALIIRVSGKYEGKIYKKEALFNIYSDTDGVIYQLLPTSNNIHISTTGLYTPNTMGCKILKKTAHGVSYLESLEGTNLRLTQTIDRDAEVNINPGENLITMFGDNATLPTIGVIYNLYENNIW